MAVKDILCIVLLFIVWRYWKEIVNCYNSVKEAGVTFLQEVRSLTQYFRAAPANVSVNKIKGYKIDSQSVDEIDTHY